MGKEKEKEKIRKNETEKPNEKSSASLSPKSFQHNRKWREMLTRMEEEMPRTQIRGKGLHRLTFEVGI